MRTILERYLERNNESGDLVQPGSPAYERALEVAGIGGDENRHTYRYVLVEMRLVRGNHPHYVIHLHGGKRSRGHWDEYLHTQLRMIQSATKRFGDAWVCMMENDVLDDVHDLIIGVEYNKELEIKNEKEKPPRLFEYVSAEESDYIHVPVSGQPAPAGI